MSDWNEERRALIRRTICPQGIPDDEFTLFMEQCTRSGLDPLLKQAFCVKRRMNLGTKERPNWVDRFEFQPSEAGMLTRAETFPDYGGIDAAEVYDGDENPSIDYGKGEVHHTVNPAKRTGKLVGAWARVVRNGKRPVVVWVDFAASVQPTPLWGRMPAVMVRKCARVAALRTAYPTAFGGLYVAGERPDDVETGEEAEASAPVLSKPALPEPKPAEVLHFSTAREKVEARVGDRECIVVETTREPGEDDVPEPSDEERCQGLEEAARQAQTLAALTPLKSVADAFSGRSPEHRKRAVAALRAAHDRIKAKGAV